MIKANVHLSVIGRAQNKLRKSKFSCCNRMRKKVDYELITFSPPHGNVFLYLNILSIPNNMLATQSGGTMMTVTWFLP